MVIQLPTLADTTPQDATRAARRAGQHEPKRFPHEPRDRDTLILEKNSTKSIAFITSISAGEEARIGPGSRAPPATGPTSSRLCRVVEKGTVGLPRQPVGKWRSSPTTGARAEITSFDTGEDGVTTVKLAVIVAEGDDEAAIEMPISEFSPPTPRAPAPTSTPPTPAPAMPRRTPPSARCATPRAASPPPTPPTRPGRRS